MSAFTPNEVTVYLKTNWADAWVEQEGLFPLNCRFSVAPEVPVATLRYDYGSVKRQTATTFADVAPLDILDQYVKIQSDDGSLIWIGVLTDEERIPDGDEVADPSGYQQFTARGLEHLLDRVQVRGTYVDTNEGMSYVFISRTHTFNVRHAQGGGLLGNMSAREIDGLLVFQAEEGITWGYADIAAYLVGWFAPLGPTWAVGGQVDDFEAPSGRQFDVVFDPSGLTVKQALDALFDRRRGYTWMLRHADEDGPDAGTVTVWVLSEFASDVTSGDFTFRSNTEQETLDISGDRAVLASPIRITRAATYDTVRVEGQPVRSCFTLSFEDSTLERAWTDDDETAYKSAASGGAGYAALLPYERADRNDRYRRDEKLARVFSLFRAASAAGAFDWNVGNGLGGSKHIAHPDLDDDGTPKTTNADYSALPRPILNQLPLLEGVNYAAEGYPDNLPLTGAQPRLRPIFAAIKTTAGDYVALDRPGSDLPACHALAVDREMAIQIQAPTPHVLARGHWTAGAFEPTAVDPAYDYEDLVVTVCAPTDEMLAVEVDSDLAPIAEYGRTLVIHIPDAELWYVAEGTVVGVSDANTLAHLADGPAVIRDDSERLRQIAALAIQWYGRARASASVQWNKLEVAQTVGGLVTQITLATSDVQDVNAVVTAVELNIETMQTSLSLAWWDVDWPSVASLNLPGLPTPRALGARLSGMLAAGNAVANWGAE